MFVNLTFDGTTLSATGQLSLAGGIVLQPGGTSWSTTNQRPQIQRQADGELRLGAGADSGSSASKGSITFHTSASGYGGTLSEKVRITTGGNLNIGSNLAQTTYVCEVAGAYNKDGLRVVSGAPNYQDPFVVASSTGGERFRIKGGGTAQFNNSVGIQTTNIDSANLSNPVGAGHSLVGLYIGDGSMMFSSALSRTGGYYISTDINALNAGPVTLNSNMKLDGTWVIV